MRFTMKLQWFCCCLWLSYLCIEADAFQIVDWDLSVTNDGPVVWGSNVTFNATMSGVPDLTFRWTWDDGIGPPVTIESKGGCLFRKAYAETGKYTMHLKVSYFVLTIKSASSHFEVTASIPGRIELFAGNETAPLGSDRYLATGTEVRVFTHLDDPGQFLSNASVLYWMYVDDVITTNAGPNFTYSFSAPGDFRVMVFVVAHVSAVSNRWASYYATVKIREPIRHINVSGNTFLQRGEMVHLIADCDGSSPWVYCWKAFKNDNTTTKEMNCSNVMTTNKCNFQIQYYFQDTGHHNILVNITNDVKRFVQIVPINIFKVLPEPDLSIIIIPVVFGLLAITIILVGLLYYVQVRRRFNIEVADFDFMSSDSITYQTFFEQLKDAVINSLPNSNKLLDRGWNFLDCRTEADTLSVSTMGSDDSEFKVSEGTIEVATAMPLQ